MTGNWRDHILVRCAVCHKLMGYHKVSDTAVCNSCKAKEAKE